VIQNMDSQINITLANYKCEGNPDRGRIQLVDHRLCPDMYRYILFKCPKSNNKRD